MLEGIRMIVLLVSLFLCAWIDWKTERVSVPLLLLGGMTAVLLHLFAQEESVFYLMTGMSVGIVLLLYSLVTHESIGYGDGCLFVMTGLFLGFWENLVLLLLASVLAGIGAAVLLFFRKKKKKERIPFVRFIVTLMEGAGYAGKYFNRGIIDRATCACGHGTCAENRNRLLRRDKGASGKTGNKSII